MYFCHNLGSHHGEFVISSRFLSKQSTVCVGVHYVQAYTNNVNKISVFLQTTGGTDEPNLNIQQYTFVAIIRKYRGVNLKQKYGLMY
jgi:hypothetical protein